MKSQSLTRHTLLSNISYFKKHLYKRSFDDPISLYNYIHSKSGGIKNLNTVARVYLNYAEKLDLIPIEVISKYRAFLKIRQQNQDFYVPTNDLVIKSYKAVKRHKVVNIVYLVLATSGIRYIEALEFLRNYDLNKFTVYANYVSYPVSDLRHTKNINNIYLPLFVYKQLFHVTNTYASVREKYVRKGGLFTLKYLRKWQYNFLIYNNVPESVADFMQGRASKSISSNHYLARSQQASFWYSKIVSKLESIFCNTTVSKKLGVNSSEADKTQKNKVGNYSTEATK